MRTDVLGVGFDNLDMAEALDQTEKLMDGGGTSLCGHTQNPEIVWLARKDPVLREAIDSAALVCCPTASGSYTAPGYWAALFKGKVPGADFAQELLRKDGRPRDSDSTCWARSPAWRRRPARTSQKNTRA